MFKHKIFGAVALSVLGAAALAHNGATGMVMERMKGMSAMRNAIRDIAPMMQGLAPYDEAAVLRSAAVLRMHSGNSLTQSFPKEPIPASSYARPGIWSEWDRFSTLSEELQIYSEGLVEAAPNGLRSTMLPMVLATPSEEESAPELTIAELMGVNPRQQGSAGAVAFQKSDQGRIVDFAVLPADDVFESIGKTCASCHALYRKAN